MRRAKDSGIVVLEKVCKRPLKVEKVDTCLTVVVAVPCRSMALLRQWGENVRLRMDIFRLLESFCV